MLAKQIPAEYTDKMIHSHALQLHYFKTPSKQILTVSCLLTVDANTSFAEHTSSLWSNYKSMSVWDGMSHCESWDTMSLSVISQ